MALQVWLPLNNTTQGNQGFYDLPQPSKAGSGSDTIGKVVQGSWGGSTIWHLTDELLPNKWTIAFWAYSDANSFANGNNIMFCKNADAAAGQIYFSIYTSTQFRLGVNGTTDTIRYATTVKTKQWYHCAATFDGTIATMYIDGIERGSATITGAYPTDCNNIGLGCRATNVVGTNPTGGRSFLLNDLRIYDECLSASQIHFISQGLFVHYKMDKTIAGVNNNLLRGSHKQSDLVAAADKLNTYDLWGFAAASSGNGTITVQTGSTPYDVAGTYWRITGNTSGLRDIVQYNYWKFLPGQSYTLSAYYRGTAAVQIYLWDQTIGNALTTKQVAIDSTSWTRISHTFTVAEARAADQIGVTFGISGAQTSTNVDITCPKLEIGSTATDYCLSLDDFNDEKLIIEDSSGYENNGTLYGTGYYMNESPRYSSCLYLYSNTDVSAYNTGNLPAEASYIKTALPHSTSTAITVSFWYKWIAGRGNSGLFCTSLLASQPTDYTSTALHMRDSVIDFCTNIRHTTHSISSAFNDSNWHLLTFTYDGHNSNYYLDGNLQNTVVDNDNTTEDYLAAFSYLYIGLSSAGSVNRMVKCYYSDFRMYATALNADDVKALYNLGAKVDNKQTLHVMDLKENPNGDRSEGTFISHATISASSGTPSGSMPYYYNTYSITLSRTIYPTTVLIEPWHTYKFATKIARLDQNYVSGASQDNPKYAGGFVGIIFYDSNDQEISYKTLVGGMARITQASQSSSTSSLTGRTVILTIDNELFNFENIAYIKLFKATINASISFVRTVGSSSTSTATDWLTITKINNDAILQPYTNNGQIQLLDSHTLMSREFYEIDNKAQLKKIGDSYFTCYNEI